MKTNRTRRPAGAIALALTTAVALAGCTAGLSTDQGGHGTRVELYSSVEALAEDSSLVLVGTVTSQRVVADIDEMTDFTISSVEVGEVTKSEVVLDSGTTIEVRQLGSDNQTGPAPLLASGGTYLLYLTPSGLEGDLAAQFYVTGGSAGLYKASDSAGRSAGGASSATFTQVQAEEGEALPSDLALDDALG